MKENLPKFHQQMLPLLEAYSDGEERKLYDVEQSVASKLNVSPDELAIVYEPTDPRSRAVFFDRLRWASTYLFKAKLLDRTATNTYKITPRGLDLLKTKPEAITIKLLRELYDDFWDTHVHKKAKIEYGEDESDDKTPEELLAISAASLRETLKQELREKLLATTPRLFELLVVQLLEKMGYGIGEVTRYSKDGGIDGLVRGDYLGFEMVYVQAKRWANDVGRREVSQFIGDIMAKGAKKGIFITTSDFNKEALQTALVHNPQLMLMNGDTLADHMIDLGLGVTTTHTYNIYKLDQDFFEEN